MTEAITSEIYTVGPNVIPDAELESLAALLEASGRYRMLRRLEPRSEYCAPDGTPTRRAVYLDVETTGLDHASDEIIELAMVPFFYSDDGRIFGVGESFERYRDPGRPIPPIVTELTGITDEMVAGRSIDPAEVETFLGEACLVVAHNARFDRGFAERLSAAFSRREWACSWNDIDWKAEGFTDGAKLSNLATASGFFYAGHRAENDCRAGIEMLSRPLPKCGRLALDVLLASVRTPRWRLRATGAPFETKDILKGRGYRWNDGADGHPRAWFIDLADDVVDAERSFLRREIYRRDDVAIDIKRLDAFDRYSRRC